MNAFRPVWAEIDLDAVRANVRALRALVAPAAVCAVVKADGYGHGAVAGRPGRARGRRRRGSRSRSSKKASQLREAGIDAPILVLSEPVPAAAETVVAHRLTPVVYTAAGIDALAKAVARPRRARPARRAPQGRHRHAPRRLRPDRRGRARRAGRRPRRAAARGRVHALRGRRRARQRLHRREQLRRSTRCSARLARARPADRRSCTRATPRARSRCPSARYDMVRVGIGIYGIAPVARARRTRSTCVPRWR